MKKLLTILFTLLLLSEYTHAQVQLSNYEDYFISKVTNNSNKAKEIYKLGVVVGDMHKNKSNALSFKQNTLNQYLDFDDGIKSPQALIREYKYKSSELDAECANIKIDIEARVDRNIDNLEITIRQLAKELNIELKAKKTRKSNLVGFSNVCCKRICKRIKNKKTKKGS